MTEEQVVELMKSSKNVHEWNANCDKVKRACNGYPPFWFKAIVLSGLIDQTLGRGAGTMDVVAR